MSFRRRVFGWAHEYLRIVLFFIIVIKLHFICLILKNNKSSTIHKYSNEIWKPTYFLELASDFPSGLIINKDKRYTVKP